jgi:hypothetical protein
LHLQRTVSGVSLIGETTRGRQRRAYRPRTPIKRLPSDTEIIAALYGSHEGVRALRWDARDNSLKLAQIARTWAFDQRAAESVSCRIVIAQKMGYAVTSQEDANRHWPAIQKYARRLEAAGVLRMHAFDVSVGIHFEFLDGWAAYTSSSRCASSSAGCSTGISRAPQRVRRAFYRQHRFAPARLRAGRGSPRLDFFYVGLSSTEEAVPYGDVQTSTALAHAHEPPGAAGAGDALSGEELLDAIRRTCPPDRRAALGRWLNSPSSPESFAALSAAASEGAVDALVAALVAWAWRFPSREPRLSHKAVAQLDRSAAQLDRLWQPGAAAALLVDWVASAEDVDHARVSGRDSSGARVTGGRPIVSLGFFVIGLRGVAREQAAKRRGRPIPKAWKPRRPGGGFYGWASA